MSDLRDLYQEVILEHSKAPRNFHDLADANHKAEGFNPLCGDQFTVYLHMDGDSIRDISFQGAGCAISKASASMMTQLVKGKSRAEAEKTFPTLSQAGHRRGATKDRRRSGQTGGFFRRLRISGAREVCHAGLAHAASSARRPGGSDASGRRMNFRVLL